MAAELVCIAVVPEQHPAKLAAIKMAIICLCIIGQWICFLLQTLAETPGSALETKTGTDYMRTSGGQDFV
jgi:hypothetical protein